MKVLLFTHEQDIDGMGCVIIGKEAFKDLVYIPCKTFEITDKVNEYVTSKEIYEYDMIFVTDLCIKEPLLSYIDKDEILRSKLQVLDHHKSEIDEGNDKYEFVSIIVENDKGKASGTSLFYDYLINNEYLKRNDTLDELVELTRQYDTWEWKKYNNYKARKLHVLFENLGYSKYLEIVSRMVKDNRGIIFNDEEENVINKFNDNLKRDVNNILNDMKIYNLSIDGTNYRIGYVKIPYKYRNDMNEEVMKNNINNIDLIGMIMTDTDTVSYRLVHDVDASIVAVYFGGKGHKAASTNLQSNEKFKDVLNLFE